MCTAAKPSDEASAWTTRPPHTPSVVKKAARRPQAIAFLVTMTVSAPGVIVISAAIPQNVSQLYSK